MPIILSLLIGVVAGSRAMLAPAAVSWAAYLGLVEVSGWLGWLGHWLTPWIFTLAAAGELVSDKLPATPSRKVPPQFITRLVTGALSGAAVAMAGSGWAYGLVAGVIGAVVGTFAGAALRGALARSFGNDLASALVEDLIAITIAAVVILHA